MAAYDELQIPCWNCGELRDAINECYVCHDCDVRESPARKPMEMFTNPAHTVELPAMTHTRPYRMTYIDHATVHAPCP